MGRSSSNAPNANDQIEQAANMVYMPYDTSRIVTLYGEINERSASMTITHMLHLSNISNEPIQLVLSTYGGSVDEMFSMRDVMKFLPCEVHTIALGKIMSAGVLILASGAKGKRLIGKSARLMIHSISGGTYGSVFDLVSQTDEVKRLHDMMVDALCEETMMTKKQLEKIMSKNHDEYMTSEQALKFGLVDKIIG